MKYTYVKGKGMVDSPLKKKVKRYAKEFGSAAKTTAKFIGRVVTEPFTNRYIKAVEEQMRKNPPASPRY